MLGLQKSSIGIPVSLTVILPPRHTGILGRYRDYLVMGAIGLAGLALVIILLRGSGMRVIQKGAAARKQFEDPLTQPVVVPSELPAVSAKTERNRRPPRAVRSGSVPGQPSACQMRRRISSVSPMVVNRPARRSL